MLWEKRFPDPAVQVLWSAGPHATAAGPYSMMGPPLGDELKRRLLTVWDSIPGNRLAAACTGTPWLRYVPAAANKAAVLVRVCFRG